MKTSTQVAEQAGSARVTVLKWAYRDGNVPRHGLHYAFDDASIKRFLGRNRQVGRPRIRKRLLIVK